MSGDDNRIDEDDEGIFDNDQNSPRTSADAAANIVIPSALPPNALLVHYSDGKTRIDSALYQRLVEAGVVSEVNSKFGRARLDSGVLEDRKARRFDDESFDMLSGSEHIFVGRYQSPVYGCGAGHLAHCSPGMPAASDLL